MTDATIARRLRDLFSHNPHYTMRDITLLRHGRHFRLHNDLKLVLGRNEEENKIISSFFSSHEHVLISPEQFPGPVALACGRASMADLEAAGGIIARYGRPQQPQPCVVVKSAGGLEKIHGPRILTDDEIESFRI